MTARSPVKTNGRTPGHLAQVPATPAAAAAPMASQAPDTLGAPYARNPRVHDTLAAASRRRDDQTSRREAEAMAPETAAARPPVGTAIEHEDTTHRSPAGPAPGPAGSKVPRYRHGTTPQ